MKIFLKIIPFLKRYKRALTIALLGTSALTLLGMLPPLLMRFLVDRVAEPQAWHLLPWAVIFIVLTPLTIETLRFFNMRRIVNTAQRIITDIRIALYEKVLNQSLRYHSEHSSGATVSRLMDDVNMVLRLLTGETLNMVIDLLVLVVSLTIAFSISARLSWILLALLMLYMLAYRVFSQQIRIANQSYRKGYDIIAGRLQETVTGVRQVRIFNREQWEDAIFRTRIFESAEKALATSIGSVNLSTACTMISGLGSTLIWGMAGFMVLRGELSYGDLLAFSSYVWMAMNPVVRLTGLAGQLIESGVSVERIAEILESENDVVSAPNASRMPSGSGEVIFENILFGYDSGSPIFHDFNLSVPSGFTVALVGPTGCGKTSLISLLMRYWDVQAGRIVIDGADIRKVDLTDLRSIFGVVLQDPMVFDGTLAYNISYGKPGASEAEIEMAAQAAEFHATAMALPDGMQTVIGKQGLKLSVGEKQRLSIARAILRNPRIMVMDEATSALDSQSELLIQRALSNVLRKRTSFIVAHRLSTIIAADLIVVMADGRIIQQGTHPELMSTQGLYRKLYDQLRARSDEPTEA